MAVVKYIAANGVLLLISATVTAASNYSYDDLNRLTKVVYDDDSSISYTYDASGNLLSVLKAASNLGGPPTLPHTGVGPNHCFAAANNTLVSCGSPAAIALSGSGKQDGMYSEVNPMRFSRVARASDGTPHDTSECVQDDLTGLTWEGKTADTGLRDYRNLYTSFNNQTAGDSSSYVTHVNSIQLCGYADWRIPTGYEFQLTFAYGVDTPYFDPAWFPNINGANFYYTSSSTGLGRYIAISLTSLTAGDASSNSRLALKLVRGAIPAMPKASRYVPLNNGSEVLDKLTNLVWMRCALGTNWTGVACTGSAQSLSHEAAMVAARTAAEQSSQAWRLPNAREFGSLLVGSRPFDLSVYANGGSTYYWSSTPNKGGTSAVLVQTGCANISSHVCIVGYPRSAQNSVRFVRNSQ